MNKATPLDRFLHEFASAHDRFNVRSSIFE
jgi:hypothetical protein